MAVETRVRGIEKAGEDDRAIGVDIVERIGAAEPQIEAPGDGPAGIKPDHATVDIAAGMPRIDAQIGMGIAGGQPRPPETAQTGIDPGDEAGEIILQRRRIAV